MSEPADPYTYRAYGLTIVSELPMPELPPGFGTADVSIRLGAVSAHPAPPTTSGVLFEASKDSYTLRVDGVARYHARAGREVTVEIDEAAPASEVRLFLLTAVMTALLHQRATLVLHAAGVVGPRGAMLIAGHSGLGKSTAAATLAMRGFTVLADDACAVIQDDQGRLTVPPGFPVLKLWRDAAIQLGLSTTHLARTRAAIEKFMLPVAGPSTLVSPPLSVIVVLEMGNHDDVRMEAVADADRLDTIRAVTRNRLVLEGLEMQVAHFRMAAAVASKVPMWRLTRPRLRDSLDQVIARLQSVAD